MNKDYKKKYLRASNPVARAIEVCALAELIQFHKVQKYPGSDIFASQNDLFARGSSTCDHFLPDIFASLCTCAGSCAPEHFDPDHDEDPPSNLILHFLTSDGLWGCQDACRNTEHCKNPFCICKVRIIKVKKEREKYDVCFCTTQHYNATNLFLVQ